MLMARSCLHRDNLGVYLEKCPSSCSPDAPLIETDSGRLDVRDASDIEAFTNGTNGRILRASRRLNEWSKFQSDYLTAPRKVLYRSHPTSLRLLCDVLRQVIFTAIILLMLLMPTLGSGRRVSINKICYPSHL